VGNSIVFRNGIEKNELLSLIDLWDTKKYNGNYYEVFGILSDNVLVGSFSLYQRDVDVLENAVCFGIEIVGVNNRMKGFATFAVLTSCKIAMRKGYRKIFSQVRTDNIASAKLHIKCGFKLIEKTYSKRGNEVYNFAKTI